MTHKMDGWMAVDGAENSLWDAISEGETLDKDKSNLLDALKLMLACRREMAKPDQLPLRGMTSACWGSRDEYAK